MRILSRRTGGNAVRTAAYNGRADMQNERTGDRFYFAHREAPLHHEVMLPSCADESLRSPTALWNKAEKAEKRVDAVVAREMVLAIPADLEISNDDRIELVRSFVEEHFVSKGIAAQIDIHAPHENDETEESANWHAHVLLTTRRVEGDRLSSKKARDLEVQFRQGRGKGFAAEGHDWGGKWRDYQNAFFRQRGYEARVDPIAPVCGEHLGPVRMRRWDTELNRSAVERAEVNRTLSRDPDVILEMLTRNSATFNERDLQRTLEKHVRTTAERRSIMEAVFQHPAILQLYDRTDGEWTGRFTTTNVREDETQVLRAAAAVAAVSGNGVAPEIVGGVYAGSSMRRDQSEAFLHATSEGGLKIIEGRAGTGKSYTLEVIRKAHARDDYRVVGLAPTNAVAQDLKANGFTEAKTIHSALFALKNGRDGWDRKTVLIVDEAAMVDTGILGALLSEAQAAGAKLILAGDDRQLASIERGGMFAELRRAHGSSEITEVTRQREGWQRQATRDLAEGRFERAVEAFDQHGSITWTEEQDQARAALVKAWSEDVAADPKATRFVFAYTNADVDALNQDLRAVWRERGELGEDVRLPTRRGMTAFAGGDRVQFTDTDKTVGVSNGQAGRITRIDPRTQSVTVRLDAAAGQPGKSVTWFATQFSGFRHGYAGTIYKGQGKTLDHSYLYHTHHWRNAASYVALTRQRESAKVFVARETAKDTRQLARQMARCDFKMASLAFGLPSEVARDPSQVLPGERPAVQQHDSRDVVPAKPGTDHGMAARSDAETSRQAQEAMAAQRRESAAPEATENEHTLEERIRQPKPERVANGGYRALSLPADHAALRKVISGFRDQTFEKMPAIAFLEEADGLRRETRVDVAREMDTRFRSAFDYAERLRGNVAELDLAVKRIAEGITLIEGSLERAQDEVGIARRVMHGIGFVSNSRLTQEEMRVITRREQHAQESERLVAMTAELGDAQRAEELAYDRIGQAVEAEWSIRNLLDEVIGEIVQERHEAKMERLTQVELQNQRDRELRRERGLDLGNDFGIE